MSSSFQSLLASQFSATVPSPQLNIIKYLKTEYPQFQHLTALSCWDGQFPLSAYLASISVTLSVVEEETHSIIQFNKESRTVYFEAISGVSTFTYDSVDFRLFKASWTLDRQGYNFYHLVFAGADDFLGQNLVKEVYNWANELKEELWVFEGGGWHKNKQLYKAVQAASWDDVVLEEKFKEGLKRDTETFFASKDVYDSLGITWKRGILLLGPPGNGKTESIKALLKGTKGANPLYVKSFTTRLGPEQGIRSIFNHARTQSPCILILEDLDSMLTAEGRSFFLNELDGLADNAGILTIATTNHPERIDDAILNRPSRFDVKYNFALPDSSLRQAFATKWLAKVNALSANTGVEFKSAEETVSEIAEKTDGWSFAFLKELFVSFLLRLAHDKSLRKSGVDVPSESPETLLMKQVDQLAEQIIKTKEDTSGEAKRGGGAQAMFPMMTTTQATHMGARGGAFAHSGVNF